MDGEVCSVFGFYKRTVIMNASPAEWIKLGLYIVFDTFYPDWTTRAEPLTGASVL